MPFSMPSDKEFSDVVGSIRKEWPSAVGIGLFGSVARGTANEGSDIDLLIVLQTGLAPSREYYSKWDATVLPDLPRGDWSPHFVECLPSDREPGSLWLEFACHGRNLWTSEPFEQAVDRVRNEIAAGIYERRKEPGTPFYWVKK
jgi:predicted nucleotidyltransferase